MKTRRSRLNAQSPNKPRLLAEKGGRIFARVRYKCYEKLEGFSSVTGNYLFSTVERVCLFMCSP